eukprot:s1406_g16.t1
MLDLGSAILKFNVFQYFNMVLCPSWLCYFHGSCDSLHVYICGSLHVHICYMCIARELEAIASFALQPLVSQTRYSASLLSSAMMQWNNITGTVAIHNGEALLRLAPASSSSAAPGPSETARAYGTPWGVTRDEQLMMATIVSGDVPVHATRMPMSSTLERHRERAVLQDSCKTEACSQRATCNSAIMDAQPAAVVNPLEIDDNTEPKENQNPETDNPEEENQNRETNNPAEHTTNADDSDSDSSTSSTSSNNSIKSEDMKKMLKDTEPETYTWTTEWGDAWNSVLRTLNDGYSNPKRRRVAYRVLKTLKEAKAE